MSGTTLYKVYGRDKEGQFEGQRRYNEFFLLNELLAKRFPGVPIPTIPPKKNFGNTDVIFIQQRRYYLERFFRKLANFDFIINSPEFRAFARPQGMNIEKAFEKMPKMTAVQTYERMREATGLDERSFDVTELEQFNNRIVEFNFFMKKAQPFLKQMKLDLAEILTNKADVINGGRGLEKICEYYEDLNLTHYLDGKTTGLVLNNPGDSSLREAFLNMCNNQRNAFVDIYHWVQGEIYDLEAIAGAVAQRAEVEKKLLDYQKKKVSTQKDIDALNQGSKTIGTLLKNKDDVGGLSNEVDRLGREVTATQSLLDLLTVYIGKEVVPTIKKDKLKLYRKVFTQFHVVEIGNNHQAASFWSTVLKDESVKASAR